MFFSERIPDEPRKVLPVDSITEHPYSHAAIPYINSVIRFSVFLIVALLIAALRKAYQQEKDLARADNLTGAVNRRFFAEILEMEMYRSKRNNQPFTIAYFDLDNFKYVNDHFGHSTGDQVLLATVSHARSNLRKIDIVARLGGDEFAILLPATGQDQARIAIAKIQTSLQGEMQRNNWPVTFSIGVLTCITIPEKMDDVIQQADALMYSIKKSGKNSAGYSFYVNLPGSVH